jgi:hypothetical protein
VGGNAVTVFFFIAFILLFIATLVAGGMITASMAWLLPGGLCSAALAFLLWSFGGWTGYNGTRTNRRV